MRVSIGDINLWFDVLNAGLVPDGPVMREKPVLLALHGGPGYDHSNFKGVLDPFCDMVQVVMYDHRGNGRSDDGDTTRWNMDQWADDVKAFCQALGIERPIVLGWSFGGFVAQLVASRHPDLPSGAIFLSTAPHLSFSQFGPAFERLAGPEAKEAARRMFFEPSPEAEEEYMRICLPLYMHKENLEYSVDGEARALKRFEVLRHFFADEAWTMDLRPGLAKVVCPTLVLNGVFDPICPPECADEIVAGLTNSDVTHVVADDASHELPIDQPELFEEAMRRFLARVAEQTKDVRPAL
jgi:pimeloyl-ACP methyl ester carboxylesterase